MVAGERIGAEEVVAEVEAMVYPLRSRAEKLVATCNGFGPSPSFFWLRTTHVWAKKFPPVLTVRCDYIIIIIITVYK